MPYINPMITEKTDEIVYKMFTICRFCDDGEDRLEMINTWRLTSEFRKILQFNLSFSGNFHKNSVRMSIWEDRIPGSHIIGIDDNGNKIYDGWAIRWYMVMGNILNVTWKFLPNRYGSPYDFGSYVPDLNDGYVDLVGCGRWTHR